MGPTKGGERWRRWSRRWEGRTVIVSLALEAELGWMAGGDGGVGDDGVKRL